MGDWGFEGDAGGLDAGGFDAGGFDAGGFEAGGFDAGGFGDTTGTAGEAGGDFSAAGTDQGTFGFGDEVAGGGSEWGDSSAAASSTQTDGFGGFDEPSTVTATATATATTTKKPASGSSDGAGAPSTTTAASSSTPTELSPAAKKAIHESLKDKTLEDILDKWRQDLDEQGKDFNKKALDIQKFDEEIMYNACLIHKLHKDTDALEQTQKDIVQNMQLAEGKHTELDQLLTGLESKVGKLWEEHQRSGQSADEERVKCYELAKNINDQLVNMQEKLKVIVEKINTTNKPEDDDNPVLQIISILNSHLEALSEIDHDSAVMQTKLREVQQQMRMRRRPN